MIAFQRAEEKDKQYIEGIAREYGLIARNWNSTEYWTCDYGIVGLESLGNDRYEIASWLVYKHYRSRGVGGYLLNFAIRQALKKGAREIYITSNKLGIYKHVFGFEESENGLGRETDKRIYVKRLNQ